MIRIIAHRGASGYAIENTLESFRKAFELKADGIELDLWPSAEGDIFIHHDESLKRIFRHNGLIHQTPSRTLQELGVPTLAEVLNMLPATAYAFLEMKGMVEERLAQDLRAHLPRLPFLPVIGFGHAQLIRFKAMLPEATIGLTYDKRLLSPFPPSRWANVIQKACADAGATHVNLDYRLTTPDLVEVLHKGGLHVNLWTVNNTAGLRIFRHSPVHAIMSDYPDKARAICHGEG